MLEQKERKIIRYKDYPYLVYARVSTTSDDQEESISNQVDIARYWLEQNGYEWNENSVLKDNGKSGTLFLERTAMQLILKKARNREIEMVVFKSIHRLARDLKDSLEIKEVLIGHGVRVVTLEEGYDSYKEGRNDMKFEMHALFASQYPKTLSLSISSALASKVRRGEHIGRIPYGYRRENLKLVIHEEEAKVIRQIFKWYNEDGIGFKNITHLLNKELENGDIPKPRNGGNWQLTTVQSIIKNLTYTGTFTLNRYTTIKVDGRKKRIENPREKWKIFENQHPAIITREEWDKANNRENVNKRRKITPWNEFRGLLRCGECGYNMIIMQSWKKKKDGTKTAWRYLKCSAYRRAGRSACVNHVPLTYENLREFVVARLKKKGKDIDLDFENMFLKQQNKQVVKVENQLISLQEKNKGLVDLYLEQLISKVEFQERREEFEKQISELETELYLMKETEYTQEEIKNIKEAFDEVNSNKKDLYHALNFLIDHITIYQDGSTDIAYNFESLK